MAKAKSKMITIEEALVPVEEQPYEVPENWCWIHLLDAFDNVTDSKKKLPTKEYQEEGEYSIVDQGQEFVGGYTDCKDMVYDGDMPVIIFGDHTRCVKYVDFPFVQGADGVKVLSPKRFWDSKAFYYAIQSVEIPNMGYRRHYPLFKNFSIPVPPLPEQQRIVEQIERLFSKLDEAKEKAQEALDSFDGRRLSMLHNAFNGSLSSKFRDESRCDEWKDTTLGSLTDIVSSKRIYKEEYQESGIPFFRSSEVVELYDKGYTDPIFYISRERYNEIKEKYGVPQQGDLLVTSVGTIGKTWIVDDREFYYKDGNLTQIKKCTELDMKYVQYFIMSNEFMNQVSDTVAGTAYNALTIVKFKKIRIPCPPIIEQKEIVRLLDKMLTEEDNARALAERTINHIGYIKKSILAKAFRGELGTNDPLEESSIELIKQIIE